MPPPTAPWWVWRCAPGAVAAPLPMLPVMTFVLNEQWVVALFRQNEVRKVQPGQEAEIALQMYPGRIIKCKVDSIVWATAQGQLPISGSLPNTGSGAARSLTPVRSGCWSGRTRTLFIAAGARRHGAIYTDAARDPHPAQDPDTGQRQARLADPEALRHG